MPVYAPGQLDEPFSSSSIQGSCCQVAAAIIAATTAATTRGVRTAVAGSVGSFLEIAFAVARVGDSSLRPELAAAVPAQEGGATLGTHPSPIELGCPPTGPSEPAIAAGSALVVATPDTAEAAIASTTIGATIAGTPRTCVAAFLATARQGPSAVVAAEIHRMTSFAAAPAA